MERTASGEMQREQLYALLELKDASRRRRSNASSSWFRFGRSVDRTPVDLTSNPLLRAAETHSRRNKS